MVKYNTELFSIPHINNNNWFNESNLGVTKVVRITPKAPTILSLIWAFVFNSIIYFTFILIIAVKYGLYTNGLRPKQIIEYKVVYLH